MSQTGLIIGKESLSAGVTQIYDSNSFTNRAPVRLDCRGLGGPDITLYGANTKCIFKHTVSDPITQKPPNPIKNPPNVFIEQLYVINADVQEYAKVVDVNGKEVNIQTDVVRILRGDNYDTFIKNNLGAIEYGTANNLFFGYLKETIILPKPV